MMTQYNEILKKIAAIPDSFGSVDIINENLAGFEYFQFKTEVFTG